MASEEILAASGSSQEPLDLAPSSISQGPLHLVPSSISQHQPLEHLVQQVYQIPHSLSHSQQQPPWSWTISVAEICTAGLAGVPDVQPLGTRPMIIRQAFSYQLLMHVMNQRLTEFLAGGLCHH
jgi:hypothetical protein